MQSQLRSMQTNTAIFGSNLVGRKSGDTSAGVEVLKGRGHLGGCCFGVISMAGDCCSALGTI